MGNFNVRLGNKSQYIACKLAAPKYSSSAHYYFHSCLRSVVLLSHFAWTLSAKTWNPEERMYTGCTNASRVQETGILVWQGAQQIGELLISNSRGQQGTAQHLPGGGPVPRVACHQPLHHLCHLQMQALCQQQSQQIMLTCMPALQKEQAVGFQEYAHCVVKVTVK